jgi:uncharacterized protein YqeY
MGLKQQIDEDIKTAMKARDKEKLEALRAIKSAFMLEMTKGGVGSEIDDAAGLKILQKLQKQRKDAGAIYVEQGREDLASVEHAQAEIIGAYLPAQMSEEEIRAVVQGVIGEVGASSMADMGKVMGAANKQLAGKADGGMVAAIVKQLLAG